MKKVFLAFCVMMSCMALAQSESRTMYVFDDKGYIYTFPVADVDSVSFVAPETGVNIAPHSLTVNKGEYASVEAQAIGFDTYYWGENGLYGVNAETKWTVADENIIQIKVVEHSSFAISAVQVFGLRVGKTTLTAECKSYKKSIDVEVLPLSMSQYITDETIDYWTNEPFERLSFISDHWSYFGASEFTTDECIIPIRMPGTNWYDNGYWRAIHAHTSPAASENMFWQLNEGIVFTNSVIDAIGYSKLSSEEKEKVIAQLEAARCYMAYVMLDCYGSFPFEDSEYVPGQSGKVQSAPEIWSKLVTCLERLATQLPKVTDANRLQYVGCATQGMAYGLLARLYLNAESFGCPAGKDYYTNVIRCCDAVINSGSYSIEDDYFTNFKIKNETSKENIFVLVKDGSDNNNRNFYGITNKARLHMLTLPYAMREVWNLKELPWNGPCATESFIKRFEYGKDVRGLCDTIQGSDACDGHGWLAGPVKKDGEVVIDKLFTEEPVILKTKVSSMTAASHFDGARMIKYEIDKTGTYRYMENDFVLLRYADILYMKAEAILRGGTGDLNTLLGDASFRKIRQRAGVNYYTSLELNELLDERGRELYWELVRRRDLIRFGKYNDPNYIDYLENTTPGNENSPLPPGALLSYINNDGMYVVLEGKNNEEKEMGMAQLYDEAIYDKREGCYEKYIYLRKTDKFYLAKVKDGYKTVYGCTLKAASLKTDVGTIDGYKGAIEDATPIQVTQDGFYHVIYDTQLNTLLIAPVEWGIRGSMNSWGYTAPTDEKVSDDGKSIEWTWSNVFTKDGMVQFQFAHGNMWKIYLDDKKTITLPVSLGKNMTSLSSSIELAVAGYYTIKLRYHLSSGELSDSYSYEVVLDKEYVFDGTSQVIGLIGSAIPGSSWMYDTDMTYEGQVDGYFSYFVANQQMNEGEFKVRLDHNWEISYGWNDMTIIDDSSNFSDPQNGNIQVNAPKTYKKIYFRFKVENNKITDKQLIFEQ